MSPVVLVLVYTAATVGDPIEHFIIIALARASSFKPSWKITKPQAKPLKMNEFKTWGYTTNKKDR